VLVKTLEQRHPDYDGPRLERQEALYCGGEEWRDEGHVGPIVGTLSAAVFSEAPQIAGVAGDWLPDWLASVDGAGSDLSSWFAEVLVDALVQRCVYIWVNLPSRAGSAPETRAEEEAGGLLDAFLVSIPAEQVIDWRYDERGRLQWVMVRDIVEDRVSVEAPRTRLHRWTYIDSVRIRRWTWAATEQQKEPRAEDEATEQTAIEHGFGQLPIAHLKLTENLHALGKLHDPAIAHLRARNDLSWALHRGAHPLLVVKTQWQDGKPILGPGYYLAVSVDGDVSYAEPSGASFKLLAEDTVQLREAMYRVVQQMAIGADSSATRSKMSAASKSADWKAMDIVLGALASVMRDLITATLRLVAHARGQDVEPVVTGLDGWSEEDIDVWLAAAAMSTDAHRYSPTFTKAVAKRQAERLLQGSDPEVLDTIRSEIDAADIDPTPYLPPPIPGGVLPGETP
jgi:hypothetical protein